MSEFFKDVPCLISRIWLADFLNACSKVSAGTQDGNLQTVCFTICFIPEILCTQNLGNWFIDCCAEFLCFYVKITVYGIFVKWEWIFLHLFSNWKIKLNYDPFCEKEKKKQIMPPGVLLLLVVYLWGLVCLVGFGYSLFCACLWGFGWFCLFVWFGLGFF